MDLSKMGMADLILLESYLCKKYEKYVEDSKNKYSVYSKCEFLRHQVEREIDNRIFGEDAVKEMYVSRDKFFEGQQPESINLDEYNKEG